MLRRSFIGMLLALLAGCNAPPAPGDPIVILISIDGFRWDYLDRFAPPNLTRLAADGVRADGLIPQFPSKTFPNHYTIVTGLTLAHHGIVSNNMRAPDIPGEFSLSNRDVQKDPRWWGGEPIWNTVEQQGKKAAAMFWPGSETVINGRQASYWMDFDDDMPNRERVNKVLGWLKLPDERRPSFVTLYFSDVDSTGHRFGPDARQTRDAVMRIDLEIGALIDGVRQADLAGRVHYVVVSDHGMSQLSLDRTIPLDDYIDLAATDVIDWAPVLGVTPKDGDVDALYNALKGKHPALKVYRREELPAEYGLTGHPRLAAVIGIADDGWNIASRRDLARWGSGERSPSGGAHGYDARLQSMHGLFIAQGPRIKPGMRVKAFENIHIYELMCRVLGIAPAKNDGDPAVTRDMLRSTN